VQDPRYLATRRHLRRIYLDPMTGTREWGLLKGPDGGIVGVHSLSPAAPMKRANFPVGLDAFEKAKTYADWKFVYVPGNRVPGLGARTPGAGTSPAPAAPGAFGSQQSAPPTSASPPPPTDAVLQGAPKQ